jgi:hypothetical protein
VVAGLRGGISLLGVVGASLVWAGPAETEAGWHLKATDESQAIEVYVRTRADRHREFLAITKVSARLSSVAAVLQDTKAMPRWLYRTREVQVLEAPEPTRGLLRVISNLPWPLADREAVIEWRMAQDEATGEVRLDGVAAGHRAPPIEGTVRMPELESHWRLKPLPGGVVEVRLSGFGHLGGNLNFPPLRAFMSTSIWQAPLESLKGLREMVQLPDYRQAQVPAVREQP